MFLLTAKRAQGCVGQYIVCGFLIIFTSMVSSAWATPSKLPYFSADYDAKIKGVSVKATREFKPLKNNIDEMNFTATSMFADLNERSQFTWEENQIKPVRFNYERSVLGKEQYNTLTFDWLNRKIISTNEDKTLTIGNPEKALDRLSFQLQLQYDLLKTNIDKDYQIADKDRIKHYRFEILGEETINTKLGKIQTQKVKVIRENQSRITYIWFASDWNNLLTRLEQFKDDKMVFELQVTKATIDGKIVTGL
jgi:hypothetical protein